MRSIDRPVILVCHKIDLALKFEVTIEEGQRLARKLGCMFVQASAKGFVNVEKAFYDVARQIREQLTTTLPGATNLGEATLPQLQLKNIFEGTKR